MAKFKKMNDAVKEVQQYIRDRKEGKITSLKTGFKKLDKCMIDGIEWNSTITIGGRPSVGKSAYSDCIIDGCFLNNIGIDGKPDFDLLDFNWELSSRVMLLRRLSARLKQTYKYIISADGNVLNDNELVEIDKILDEQFNDLPITFCEEPQTVNEFVNTVERHVSSTGKKTLVRIDHTLLARQSASESSQVQMLLNLLMGANSLKKKLPVIFMFLTQVNREFEDRQEDGTDRAFPRQSDVYGGDAAAMFSETILLLNKPTKYGIRQYGKRGAEGSIVVEDNDLFAHIVKNRNSEGDFILRYKENFKHMTIKEY